MKSTLRMLRYLLALANASLAIFSLVLVAGRSWATTSATVSALTSCAVIALTAIALAYTPGALKGPTRLLRLWTLWLDAKEAELGKRAARRPAA